MTYDEFLVAASDSGLQTKVRVACVIAAENIRTNVAATTGQKAWARSVFQNPESGQTSVLWAVLAQNKTAALSAVVGATDAQVQTAVDAAIALFTE